LGGLLAMVPQMPAAAAEEAYPSRPVRIVVPYAPAGVTDVMARVIADQMSKSLGQPFVVENKAGAGGVVGMEAVHRSPHDGYTLVMMPANLTILKVLYHRISFDPINDFVPIANVGASPVGIAVHPSLPVRSVPELVRYVRANPGLGYASCGIASPQHLAGEYLRSVAEIDLNHIPYKGCGEAVTDVMAGRVKLFFASIPHLIPYRATGQLIAIGVTGASESALVPGVPTVASAGYPDFNIEAWFGLLAPKGTPPEILRRLNAEVNKALQSPVVLERMKQQNFAPVGGSAEAFGATILADVDRLGGIARQAGITAD
jgi:tripartite-type tricarboxylate transporter receptor subunit TctC